MVIFGTNRLIRKELRALRKVISKLEDVEERTQESIQILKKIAGFLDQGGHSEKATKLRDEITLLEKEIYEDQKAERLATLVKDTLPKIIKGKI